jgi:hypothetical protein
MPTLEIFCREIANYGTLKITGSKLTKPFHINMVALNPENHRYAEVRVTSASELLQQCIKLTPLALSSNEYAEAERTIEKRLSEISHLFKPKE